MITKNIIRKSLDEAILKCSNSSSKAIKLGATVKETIIEDNDGQKIRVFQYEDGTILKFHETYGYKTEGYRPGIDDDKWYGWEFENIISANTDYDFFGDRCYEEFEQLDNELFESLRTMVNGKVVDDISIDIAQEMHIPTDWQRYQMYIQQYAGPIGMVYNHYLKTGGDVSSFEKDRVKIDHDWFVDLEKNTRIDHTNYATIRHSTDEYMQPTLSKKRVSDKGHTSTSVGGITSRQINTFGEKEDWDATWKTVTLIDKGGGATGMFFGNVLKRQRGGDWEAEVNFAPNQKFERILIDEKNRIIVQKPVVKQK